jgi:hypothetical protein
VLIEITEIFNREQYGIFIPIIDADANPTSNVIPTYNVLPSEAPIPAVSQCSPDTCPFGFERDRLCAGVTNAGASCKVVPKKRGR